jgi:hypothetical protein
VEAPPKKGNLDAILEEEVVIQSSQAPSGLAKAPQPLRPEAPAQAVDDQRGPPSGPMEPPSIGMDSDRSVQGTHEDILAYGDYADAIVGVINHPKTKHLTLAVNAAWGTGKTSLASLVEERLLDPATGHTPAIVCRFNAWNHDEDDTLPQALVRRVAATANQNRSLAQRILRPLPLHLAERHERAPLLAIRLLWPAAALLALAILVLGPWVLGLKAGLPLPQPTFLKTALAAFGALSLPALLATLPLGAALSKAFEVAGSVATYAKDPQREAEAGSLTRVREQLSRLVRQACRPGQKFVLVVDDLERCRPPRAVDVLEVVSQLLDDERVVVILLADMSGVAANVEVKYAELASRYTPDDVLGVDGQEGSRAYGRRYLQKIVHLQFDLPPLSDAAMRTYLARLAGSASASSPKAAEAAHAAETEAAAPRAEPAAPRARVASRTILRASSTLLFLVFLPFSLLVLLRRRRVARLPLTKPQWALLGGVGASYVTSLAVLLAATDLESAGYVGTNQYNATLFVLGLSLMLTAVLAVVYALVRARQAVASEDRQAAVQQLQRSLQSNLRAEGLPDQMRTLEVAQAGDPTLTREDARRAARAAVLQYLGEDSADFGRAWRAGQDHVPNLPRSGKRYLNRIRLWLFLRYARRLDKAGVTPEHVGQWAALHERWPEVGQRLFLHPGLVKRLQAVARDPARFRDELERVAPLYAQDDELREFVVAASSLWAVLGPLATFSQPSSVPGDGSA